MLYNVLNLNKIATESVAIQIDHGFPKSFDAIIENLQFFRKEYLKKFHDGKVPNLITDLRKLLDETKTFYTKYTSKKIKDTINKAFGINVKLRRGPFACGWTGDDLDGFIYAYAVSKGYVEPSDLNKSDQVKLEDFLKAYKDSLDKTKAKVKIPKGKLDMVFYFDLDFTVFADIRSYGNVELPTPQEITAITLHEIGHYFTILEQALNLYNLCYLGSNLVYQIKEYYNYPDKIITYYESNKDTIMRYLKKIENNSLLKNVIDSVPFQRIKTLLEAVINNFETVKNNVIKGISTGALTALAIARILLLLIITFIPFFPILNYMDKIAAYLNYQRPILIKDALIKSTKTVRESYLDEKLADEFAVRFGYGPYLMSGLEKYVQYGVHETDTYLGWFLFKDTWYCRMLASLNRILDKFSFLVLSPLSFTVNTEYERLYDRFKHIKEAVNQLLKDPKNDLPSDTQKAFIEIVYQTETEFKKSKLKTLSKFMSGLLDYIFLQKHIKNFFDILIDGKLTPEIHEVLKAADQLINNALYSRSAMIKNLT